MKPSGDELRTERFLSDSRVLIVDSNSSARTRLVAGLVQLGARRPNILSTGSFEEARANISGSEKPRIVLCDYLVQNRSGLDLLQEHRASVEEMNQAVFILVTANPAQSAVARAAEEDVDTFILKPYTQDLFRSAIHQAVSAKLEPSEYLKSIRRGKDQLSVAKTAEAIESFEKALTLSPQPSLACYYLGQVDLMKNAITQATESFEKGLSFSRIHFKCLLGLYEALTQQKRFDESYEVVKRIAHYFPANPQRVASALRLAVVTHHYDDVESYYQIFLQHSERSDELVNYMCSALVVSAKHFLYKGETPRAMGLFEKAIVSAAGRTRFTRYAIECLLGQGCVDESESILRRFPRDAREREDYLISDLLISGKQLHSGQVILRARDLLKRGIETPVVYQVIIEHAAKSKLKDLAESMIEQALKKWPEQESEFRRILTDNLPQR